MDDILLNGHSTLFIHKLMDIGSVYLSVSMNMFYEHWLPRWPRGEESAYQCERHRRHGFSLWTRKIPLEEEVATTSSILTGKLHG